VEVDEVEPPAEPEPVYTLALVEARRGFDALVGELDIVRGRALSIIGMGGLAAAFLGGLNVSTNGHLTGWTWAAVVSFMATALLCVYVLLPKRLTLTMEPSALVAWAEGPNPSQASMERSLTLWLESKYEANRPAVDRLLNIVALACLTFLVEVGALVVDLARR
jgi:MFS family permease